MLEKYLEDIYREEFIRTKAKYDYEQHLAAKSAKKKEKEKYFKALTHIIWGGTALYLVYKIYLIFV